ncbi:MAG: phosphatidylserine decarboxylase [Gammaproteobacteria bacterium]|nr:phosphatidylserine decarboxylase [Gammaproteobacteria bacterium]
MLPIAEEVRLTVGVGLILTLTVTFSSGILPALPMWLLLVLLVAAFRDSSRNIPASPLASVSPIDGRIVDVTLVADPYLKRDALRIGIKQNLYGEFNVHSPIEARIQKRWYPHAKTGYLSLQRSVSRFALWLQSDEKDDVVVAINLDFPLRIVHCKVQTGDRVGHGRRCGLIGFGRRVDIYLPATARCEVKPGQRVNAGSDIIAILRHG